MGTRTPTNFKWDKGKKKLSWTRDNDPYVIGYEVFVGKDAKNMKYIGFYHQTLQIEPGVIPEEPSIDDTILTSYGLTLPTPTDPKDLAYAFAYSLYNPPYPLLIPIIQL